MTQEEIIAYVDGELGPIEALRFERAMEGDPSIAAEVDRHRALRRRITGHFAAVAAETPPGRLSALLERGGTVVAFPAPGGRGSSVRARYAALAATLVAGLAIGQILPIAHRAPLGERNGAVVAQGDLAEALDTQLASAPQDAAYRIGVSFRSTDARYCRTFIGPAGQGLGCHGAAGWTVEHFVAGGPRHESGAYRQAASPSADILAAAQDMMAGSPLDAEQERQAKAAAWLTR